MRAADGARQEANTLSRTPGQRGERVAERQDRETSVSQNARTERRACRRTPGQRGERVAAETEAAHGGGRQVVVVAMVIDEEFVGVSFVRRVEQNLNW